jgi:FtsP/CotA-like multicopper oxidase with cupredoxin domain
MWVLIVALACTPSDTKDNNPITNGADSGGPTEPISTVPELWGLTPAEDRTETDDLVEVNLQATMEDRDWFGEGSFEGWTYDGKWPGPVIQITEGQTLRVNFLNELEDETTIHWHGLRITEDMDGVPAMQDPIVTGDTFVYEFTPPDSGTYWYHPHVRSHQQIERGLHGMLIVHEKDAVEVDVERAFVLDDIYLNEDGSIAPSLIAGPIAVRGRLGNRVLVNGSLNGLTGEIREGAVERWRLVNTSNARTLEVDVEGARWRVIAVDGNLLPEPYEVRKVYMPVGRRFDLEVIPESDEVQLQIVVATDTGDETISLFTGSVTDEPSQIQRDGDWLDWGAGPLPEIVEPTQEITMEFSAVLDEFDNLTWAINGASWGDHETIEVTANTPTKIILRDTSGRPHPFHLHGQFFQVTQRNGQAPAFPGLLDTVQMTGDDEVHLQTNFDNPGMWMAHCHILEHAELGMMTMIHVTE